MPLNGWKKFVFFVSVFLSFFPTLALHAQGFTVTPMRIETAKRPGVREEINIRFENRGVAEQVVTLKVVDLKQSDTGGWRIYDENFESDERPSYSCVGWVSFDRDTFVIPGNTRENAKATLAIPRDARGAYFAAIIAEPPLSEEGAGFQIRTRYLIPLIIHIEGRAVRQQIELNDLEMKSVPAHRGRAATTGAAMNIVNDGLSFSRVRGALSVDIQRNERWLPVARAELPERGIMPGAAFPLQHDLRRRLPSGTYRLRGEVYVDGRRLAPETKIVEFEGDPDVDTLALDTTLELEPATLAFSLPPGAARTSHVSVENPAEDPIVVRVELKTPAPLTNVEYDGIDGTAFSAVDLIQVRPQELTLPPNSSRNLRVSTRLPRDAGAHSCYYATLNLHAEYRDGQSAGKTSALLTVHNQDVEKVREAELIDVSFSSEDEDKFIITCRFANKGNVHITPSVTLELLDPRGVRVTDAVLEGDDAELLPLVSRRFSGVLDIEGVEEGNYTMRIKLLDGNNEILNEGREIRISSDLSNGIELVVGD